MAALQAGETHSSTGGTKLNIVLISTANQGYGDLGCFGYTTIRTTHPNGLAKDGRKFTSFMSVYSVCTPSRSVLLAGCYPHRIDLSQSVLYPSSNHGLNPAERTIADHLKEHDDASA